MAQTSIGLSANIKVTHYDFDPDVDTAVDVAWVDMRDFDKILATFFRTVGTSALDTFKILGNAESDGSGADVIIKTHAVANEPNALGDYIYLECTAEEIAQEGADAGEDVRYVTISAEFATSTDEGVVTYVREGTRRHLALTAESVA